MLEKIKMLYGQLDNLGNKSQFIRSLAEARGKSENTLDVHWFGGRWKIPEKEQPYVLNHLEEYVKLQEKHNAEKAALFGKKP